MLYINTTKIGKNMGIIELTLLKKLIEKVRKFDEVELKVLEEDIATEGIMKLEEQADLLIFYMMKEKTFIRLMI